MRIKKKKAITITTMFAFSIQVASCGTLLYPEREGQKAGKLNLAVVALDAVGLLFFLVPGIIAFAVDYSNGTLYLPSSSNAAGSNRLNALAIKGEITDAKIQHLLFTNTRQLIDISDSEVTRTKISTDINEIAQSIKLY